MIWMNNKRYIELRNELGEWLVSINALRLLIAFVLAPMAAPAVLVIPVVIRGGFSSVQDLANIFLLFTPFAYITVLVLGVPAILVFHFFHLKGVIPHFLGGAALGLIASQIILSVFGAEPTIDDYVSFALAGGISALTFWLIAYASRHKAKLKSNQPS